MEESSQRILVEAAYIGVFRREESSLRRIPQSSLPVPKFAAKVVPCSYPLTVKILEFPGSLLFTVIKQLWKVDAGVAPPTRKSTISFFESIS